MLNFIFILIHLLVSHFSYILFEKLPVYLECLKKKDGWSSLQLTSFGSLRHIDFPIPDLF